LHPCLINTDIAKTLLPLVQKFQNLVGRFNTPPLAISEPLEPPSLPSLNISKIQTNFDQMGIGLLLFFLLPCKSDQRLNPSPATLSPLPLSLIPLVFCGWTQGRGDPRGKSCPRSLLPSSFSPPPPYTIAHPLYFHPSLPRALLCLMLPFLWPRLAGSRRHRRPRRRPYAGWRQASTRQDLLFTSLTPSPTCSDPLPPIPVLRSMLTSPR
jgi:hypothetical protein